MKINWDEWIANPHEPITREELAEVFKEKLGIDEDEIGKILVFSSGKNKTSIEFLRDVQIKLA